MKSEDEIKAECKRLYDKISELKENSEDYSTLYKIYLQRLRALLWVPGWVKDESLLLPQEAEEIYRALC